MQALTLAQADGIASVTLDTGRWRKTAPLAGVEEADLVRDPGADMQAIDR